MYVWLNTTSYMTKAEKTLNLRILEMRYTFNRNCILYKSGESFRFISKQSCIHTRKHNSRLKIPHSACCQSIIFLPRRFWKWIFHYFVQLMPNAVSTELGSPRVTNQYSSSVSPKAILQPLMKTICKAFIVKHISKHNKVPPILFQIQNVFG